MKDGTIATLWVPGPLPGMNELISAAKRPSWSKTSYTTLKKKWTEDVWKLAKSARMLKFPGDVVITFEWLEKNKRRDPDNVAAGGRKLVLDGLVMAGVLQGDGWRYVRSWTDRFNICGAPGGYRNEPGVGVTVHHIAGAVLMSPPPEGLR